MTYQGDPNRPPLPDDPDLRRPVVEDRGFNFVPILAAAALVLVLGYLFLAPSGDPVTTPTSNTDTRVIERPVTPAPATAPAPATTPTPPAQKPSPN